MRGRGARGGMWWPVFGGAGESDRAHANARLPLPKFGLSTHREPMETLRRPLANAEMMIFGHLYLKEAHNRRCKDVADFLLLQESKCWTQFQCETVGILHFIALLL